MAEPTTRLRLRVSPGADPHGARRPARRRRGRCASAPRPSAGARTTPSCGCSPTRLHVPRGSVSVVSGHTSRDKVVELHGLDPDEAAAPAGGRDERDRHRPLPRASRRSAARRRRDREPPRRRTRARSRTRPSEPTYQDNHLGDVATATFDREMASTLEDNSTHVLAEIDAALQRIDEGTYGLCEKCGKPIGVGAPRGAAVGDALHRRQAQAGAGMIETARKPEFRPGSRTDGLAPISVAGRSLAAAAEHWLGLAAVAVAAIVADQLTKHVVASQLRARRRGRRCSARSRSTTSRTRASRSASSRARPRRDRAHRWSRSPG